MTHPTVQGGVAILKPNTQKKIRIFAEEGQFSGADRAKLLMFEDSEDLNLKSHARASQSEVKNILQNCTPTSTVEMHFELETEKKPKLHLAFPCETCEKAFAYREALLSHMKKKHSITLPHIYQCKYCDFKGASNLKAHRAHERHHEKKASKKTVKYHCPTCEEKFKGEKQLSGHIKKAHTEHLCRLECGEKFLNKAEERKHFLNKHNKQSNPKSQEVPPPCQICGHQYSWITGLQKHLRKSSCGEELEERRAGKKEEVVGGEKDKEMDCVEKNKDEDGVQMEEDAVVMVKEVVAFQGGEKQGGGGDKEKQLRQRGKKRKTSSESENESEYEKIRKENIREKEGFLASLDFEFDDF